MAINKSFWNHLSEIGHLEDVQIFLEDDYAGAVVGLDFVFSNATMSIGVNEKDDSIVVDLKALNEIQKPKNTKSHALENIFENMKSYTLLWVWELTNQQGYIDGCQLEFTKREIGDESNIIYQFIVASSTIKIYASKRII